MSRYVLAHIELPLELFPDGTHKIHNDRSNIYFETLGRLPPYQQNTQFDLAQLLSLSSQSPQTSITKVSLEECTNNDQTLVFRSVTASDDNVSDNNSSDDTASDELLSDEEMSTKEDLGKVLEKQYVVHKHEILPRRPKSERYTFRLRPKHKSSLYSRRAPV